MSDMIKIIKTNISNLRFSVEFDTYDLTYRQQDLLIRKIDELESLLNDFVEKN